MWKHQGMNCIPPHPVMTTGQILQEDPQACCCCWTQQWLRKNCAWGAAESRQGSKIQLHQKNIGKQRVPAPQVLNYDTGTASGPSDLNANEANTEEGGKLSF